MFKCLSYAKDNLKEVIVNSISSYSRHLLTFVGISVIVIASVFLLWFTRPEAVQASSGFVESVSSAPAATQMAEETAKAVWCVQTPENDCKPKACEAGKPIMVLFTAKWCGYCKHLENKVLPDPEVQKLLKKFSLIVIDSDVNSKLVEESGVQGYPTFFIINKSCDKMLETLAGTPMTPKAFVKQFERHTAH